METLVAIYDMNRRSREILFEYCETLPPEVYTAERPGISHGSIRDIHLHVTDCYKLWLGCFGLQDPAYPWRNAPPSAAPDVATMRQIFAEVDTLVARFLEKFGPDLNAKVSRKASWQEEPFVVTPLWLFSHTTSHEFHHKGQIVLFGREAGYAPPETDLIP